MVNALVYHVASGQAFFSGAALIVPAVITSRRAVGRWLALTRNATACPGLSLVDLSAPPLPGWFYLIAGPVTFAWLVAEGSSRVASPRVNRWVRSVVLPAWLSGAVLEFPAQLTPALPRPGDPPVDIAGDSISAGMGGKAETRPGDPARRHDVPVHDFSPAGATVASAMREQTGRLSGPGSLVQAGIGGNDALGETTPGEFERGLDALLARLRRGDRSFVMVELPLPPFYNRYGAARRRPTRRHGVSLIPKRVLPGVMTSRGATHDTVHLTRPGHELMAERKWQVMRGAIGRGKR